MEPSSKSRHAAKTDQLTKYERRTPRQSETDAKKKSGEKKVHFGEPVIIEVDDASSTVPEHKSRTSKRSSEQTEMSARKHKDHKYDEGNERVRE